jgi:hypothetical protein
MASIRNSRLADIALILAFIGFTSLPIPVAQIASRRRTERDTDPRCRPGFGRRKQMQILLRKAVHGEADF